MSDLPLNQALARQREACRADPCPDASSRRHDLQTLRRFVLTHQDALCEAISQDFGHRSRHETLLTEVVPLLKEIDHALRHLQRWMKPQSRQVDRLAFGLARNQVIPQPLGVVGVIVPWNFPLMLSLAPLVSIFAAGNRAMVKMSEHSRHLTALLQQEMPGYFPADKLCFFEETGQVGVAFSALPLDHLLFTGSTATGRSVMASASTNLVPVTLELGGRSPALVTDDFDVRVAAQRILYAKCLNAGQICTTVDHVYLPRTKVDAFVQAAQRIVAARYPSIDSPDLTSVIHADAYQRLVDALDEAQQRGAQVLPLVPGKARDAQAHRLVPHLVLNAPLDCRLMQREIFGPILPVIAYDDVHDVVRQVQAGPRPLAFYPFTHDARWLDQVLQQVMSGGVSVNDALFHVAQPDLPFGGVGASGMGHYHGLEGFQNFSKLRPVFRQARWTVTRLVWPPYGRVIGWLLKFFVR